MTNDQNIGGKSANPFPTILIAGVTVVAAILAAILAPGSFLIHPDFDIAVASESGSSGSIIRNNTIDGTELREYLGIIEVTNKGWIQAHDVQITIRSDSDSSLAAEACDEEFVIDNTDYRKQHSIKLDRLSINLECQFLMGSKESTRYTVTVTADNSPAFQYSPSTQRTEQLSDFLGELAIFVTLSALVGILAGLIRKLSRNAYRRQQ